MGKGVEQAFEELKISYDTFFYQLTDWEEDNTFQNQLEQRLQQADYQVVFSINFNPLIARVCEDRRISYVSWVYDSPIHIRNLEALKLSCNHIFFFDRGQAEEYAKMGIAAQHMPLAGDIASFGRIHVSDSEMVDYETEVAMVGKLYQTEYMDYMKPLTLRQRGYLEGLVASQKKIYGGYFLDELLTDSLLAELNVRYDKVSVGRVQLAKRELEFLLAEEITKRERLEALALLSNHFKVDLYSTEMDERLSKVRRRPYVDYYSKMPKVFKAAKINLNISLKTIRTGIPLRVLDIMACGGFVISNYQEEIEEYFRIGEEIVTYGDLEELFYLCDYYLKHEGERKRIAANGLERIRQDFGFTDRIRTILGSEKG